MNLQTAQAWRGEGWGGVGGGALSPSDSLPPLHICVRHKLRPLGGTDALFQSSPPHNPSGGRATPSQDEKSNPTFRQAIRILSSLMEKEVEASPACYTSASAQYIEITGGNVSGVTRRIACWKLNETKLAASYSSMNSRAFH